MSIRRLFVLAITFTLALLLPASASALKLVKSAGSPGGSSTHVATADFNGDDMSDLVTSNGPSTGSGLHVQLSNGNGTFAPRVTIDGSEPGYYTVATGDISGDGKPDLVGLRYQTGVVTTWINDGSGAFTAGAVQYPGVNIGSFSSIALGRIDSDNRDDLIIGGINNFAYGISNGTGFGYTTVNGLSGGDQDSAAIGDFNGDGFNDAVFSSYGQLIVAQGDGSTLSLSGAGNPYAQSAPVDSISTITVGDFNGDDRDDVAATSWTETAGNPPLPAQRPGTVQTWLGNATPGTLLTHNNSSGGTIDSPYEPDRIVSGDFNRDGDLDLGYSEIVRPNGPREYFFSVALGNGDGTFASPGNSTRFAAGFQSNEIWSSATGDFNGDGALDSVNQNVTNGLAVMINAPDIAADPDSVSYSRHKVGTSTPRTVNLINQGGPGITVAGIELSGSDADQFELTGETEDCVAALPPAQSCPIEVTFNPTSVGNKSATLAISTSNGPNLAVPLSGTGEMPEATFNPSGQVQFNNVNAGSTSPSQTITITSSGDSPLEIGVVSESAGDSGSFEIVSGSDTCSNATLNPTETCEFKVVFSPILEYGLGFKALEIDVPNNADSSDQKITVTGTSVNPQISVTPTSKNFGTVSIGEPDSTQVFTINSTGTGGSNGNLIVNNSDITITGEDDADFFAETPVGCGTLAPGTSCTVKVHFSPQEDNGTSRMATLNIASNATGSPTEINLSGNATFGGFTMSPEPPDFGEQRKGITSPVKLVTLTSDGTAPLKLDQIGYGGDDEDQYEFVSDTCSGQTIPIGQTCQVGLTMTPTRLGDLSDFGFGFDYPGGGYGTQVLGTGIDPGGTFSPTTQDFGSLIVGSTGVTKTLKLTSSGTTPLAITSAEITGTDAGSFRLEDGAACNGTKAPAATCELDVTFVPTGSAGVRMAKLSLTTNAGTVEASLSGTAEAPPVASKIGITLKSAKKVKRGKTLVVTAKVSNIAGGVVAGIVIATAIAAKTGTAPKAIKLPDLQAGQSITRKIKVKVKKKAKPGKKLAVTVKAIAGGRTLAKAKRVAKIKK